MILLANVLYATGSVLDMALGFFIFVVIARAVISWVNPDPYNPIVRFLIACTDPLSRPIRRYLPSMGGIDLSPFVLILVLYFVKIAVAQTLLDYALRLKG